MTLEQSALLTDAQVNQLLEPYNFNDGIHWVMKVYGHKNERLRMRWYTRFDHAVVAVNCSKHVDRWWAKRFHWAVSKTFRVNDDVNARQEDGGWEFRVTVPNSYGLCEPKRFRAALLVLIQLLEEYELGVLPEPM